MTTLFETVQILGVILVLLITTIRLNIYMVLPWPNLKRFLNKFNEEISLSLMCLLFILGSIYFYIGSEGTSSILIGMSIFLLVSVLGVALAVVEILLEKRKADKARVDSNV